jgi:hypothetical protein
MKNIIIIIAILSTFGILLRNSDAAEEKRVIVIEMGESGQIVEFPMSSEEISDEDAKNTRLVAIREAKLKKPEERKQIIEMGESGQFVEFQMSPEEIAAEDAENARLAAIREARLKKPQKQVVTFELAEIGIIIEFPVNYTENQHKYMGCG